LVIVTLYKRILIYVGILLLLAATAFLAYRKNLSQFDWPDHPDLYVGISQVAARKVAASLGGDRRAVVLAVEPSKMTDNQEARRAAFLNTLETNGVDVIALESFSIVESRERTGSSWGIPTERYNAIRRDHPEAPMIFLSGLPLLESPPAAAQPPARPRMIAVSEFLGLPDLKPYFEANQLDMAIVYRPDPPVYEVEPVTPEEWFDFSCRVLTPESGDVRRKIETADPPSETDPASLPP
jgi:hypothetical protein